MLHQFAVRSCFPCVNCFSDENNTLSPTPLHPADPPSLVEGSGGRGKQIGPRGQNHAKWTPDCASCSSTCTLQASGSLVYHVISCTDSNYITSQVKQIVRFMVLDYAIFIWDSAFLHNLMKSAFEIPWRYFCALCTLVTLPSNNHGWQEVRVALFLLVERSIYY